MVGLWSGYLDKFDGKKPKKELVRELLAKAFAFWLMVMHIDICGYVIVHVAWDCKCMTLSVVLYFLLFARILVLQI